MTLSELKKDDYLGLTWHFVLFAVCVGLAGAGFYVVGSLNTEANRQLNIARGDMSSAQAALDQIEQEEAAIAANIDAYNELAAKGVAGPADRLDMQERFALIRSQFSLFPIQLDIDQESSYTLPYAPEIAQPGKPVNLVINRLDTSLPLLHENDLANFLDALLASPSMLVPTSCTITASSRDSNAYLRLGQHQQSACTFLWYNFQVAQEVGMPL